MKRLHRGMSRAQRDSRAPILIPGQYHDRPLIPTGILLNYRMQAFLQAGGISSLACVSRGHQFDDASSKSFKRPFHSSDSQPDRGRMDDTSRGKVLISPATWSCAALSKGRPIPSSRHVWVELSRCESGHACASRCGGKQPR